MAGYKRASEMMLLEVEGLLAQFNAEDKGRLSWHLLQWTERYVTVNDGRASTANDYKLAIEVYYATPGASVIIDPVVGQVSCESSQFVSQEKMPYLGDQVPPPY